MGNREECTQERFLRDVKDHQIIIEKDDGVHRFVRFRRAEGGSYYWFDLITWPGNLCISGDFGTYVFSRESDMFKFFRMDDGDFNKRKDSLLNINPGYWGEKLQSIGTNTGYEEFSEEEFETNVKYFDSYMATEIETEIEKDELWDEIKEEVLNYTCYGSDRVHQRLNDFDHERFTFDLEQFGNSERYTFHFIWCLYAIVWGIMKYDEYKNGK